MVSGSPGTAAPVARNVAKSDSEEVYLSIPAGRETEGSAGDTPVTDSPRCTKNLARP